MAVSDEGSRSRAAGSEAEVSDAKGQGVSRGTTHLVPGGLEDLDVLCDLF